jgi:hypothetical protein
MIRWRRCALLLVWLPAFAVEVPPTRAAHDSRIWVGRHREIEEYLRTAECVSVEMIGADKLARCTLRPGGPAARMAWRPLPPGVYRGFRESYKAEIAAYELDKLLKMDMVPPSVERQMGGNRGAAQLWVEEVTDLRGPASPGGSSRAYWARQVVRMRMFDDLIGNADRNAGNALHDPAWNLILIDHSRAFGDSARLPVKLERVDEAFWASIESLTRPGLDAALGEWLGPREIQAVLDRRDMMRAEIRRLPK